MKQIEDSEGSMASQGKTKLRGETQVKQIGREVAFKPPDAELMSGPLQPNEYNGLLREEILDEVEEGETQVELVGREVSFDPPDEELMSGPINPNEDDDLLRDEILEEVESEEN